jgi:hypothetical protein
MPPDRPKCEKHPYILISAYGCVLCVGEELARRDRGRRPDGFNMKRRRPNKAVDLPAELG